MNVKSTWPAPYRMTAMGALSWNGWTGGEPLVVDGVLFTLADGPSAKPGRLAEVPESLSEAHE